VYTIAIMLYLVGLGLADEKDITVKGLEIVKKAERVYLEAYTAVLLVEKEVAPTVGSLLWPSRHYC
jgi:diphthamide biosynthesis methyltransferase